ncbi:class I SAM-dependent methyltransferase [Rubrimonas sp.]|uniref:class I SAM-dependent methyltransferase n=1 Tax=Rubrimonas sp. TaxID=2036015 RepID=UPI002FDE1FA6
MTHDGGATTASGGAVCEDDVVALYHCLLDRAPESRFAIEAHMTAPSVRALVTALVAAPEYQALHRGVHPWEIFAASCDARSIILSHAAPTPASRPGCLTNYLGVTTDVRFVASLASRGGEVEGPPIPGNFHAEMVEWAAVLRSVDLARGRYAVLELGAGWGCWMVNAAAAARARGLATFAVGVEGDPDHVAFMRAHCAGNGFGEDVAQIVAAVAGPAAGVALFPMFQTGAEHYGQEPRFFPDAAAAEAALATGAFRQTPVVTLSALLGEHGPVDLVHIDIQGGETDLVAGSLDALGRLCRYLVIGTHSRTIDGDLLRLLGGAGWTLEFEKPATIAIDPAGGTATLLDGTQGWRNSRL